MKKTLPIITIFSIILVVVPLIVFADTTIEDPLGNKGVEEIIDKIVMLLQAVAISVGTIMIIISGIQYLTSAGDEAKTTKAKKTILWTIVGVAIVIAAGFIVKFIKEILGKLD